MFMNAETFRARLGHIAAGGYHVMKLGDVVAGLQNPGSLPSAPVVLTIDDGWYSTFSEMLPALADHGFSATLYCDTRHLELGRPVPHVMSRYFHQLGLGGNAEQEVEHLHDQALDQQLPNDARVAAALEFGSKVGIKTEDYLANRVFDYMTPDELRTFAGSPGITVELHTHRHTMGDHSAKGIHQEISDNREALAHVLARPPESFTHFCYPSGRFTKVDADTLRAVGVVSATSTQQGLASPDSDPMLLPRILDGEHLSMLEFEAEISGFLHVVRKAVGRSRIGYGAPFS